MLRRRLPSAKAALIRRPARGRRRPGRTRGGLAVASLILGASLAPGLPTAEAEDAAALARAIAAPWPALQRNDGSYTDYLQPYSGGRYGEAMLGLALLRTGLREADDALVGSGLRGIGFALDQGARRQTDPSVFEAYALSAAYNVARERLAGDPRFEALRPRWDAWLLGVRPVFLWRRPRGFFNKHLVEANAWLELVASGLRSTEPGTVLADPERAIRSVVSYVNADLPQLTASSNGRFWGREGRLLADRAPSPLAYHALSFGFLARAVSRMGALASPAAHRTLREAAWASWGLMGPDGDLAYTGRSHQHVWALTMSAYGAATAASRAGPPQADLLEVASRSLARLRARHAIAVWGVAIAPALLPEAPYVRSAIDDYVDATGYAGLTLLALDWVAERGELGTPVGGALAADRPGSGLVRSDGGSLGVVRGRQTWLAVRSAGDPHGDLRSHFGLVALKQAGAGGWDDLLRPPPRAFDFEGTGPIILKGTRRLSSTGGTMSADPGGVLVSGSFADAVGRSRLNLAVTPTACGVHIGWAARRGVWHEFSTFFRPAFPPHRIDAEAFVLDGQLVRTSGPAVATVESGYASASDTELARARISFQNTRAAAAGVWIEASMCRSEDSGVAAGAASPLLDVTVSNGRVARPAEAGSYYCRPVRGRVPLCRESRWPTRPWPGPRLQIRPGQALTVRLGYRARRVRAALAGRRTSPLGGRLRVPGRSARRTFRLRLPRRIPRGTDRLILHVQHEDGHGGDFAVGVRAARNRSRCSDGRGRTAPHERRQGARRGLCRPRGDRPR
jgi:hypothetical protein